MQVRQTMLVALLKELGLETADRWDAVQTERQVNGAGGLARFVPAPRPTLTPVSAELLDAILAHQGGGRLPRPLKVLAETAVAAQTVKPGKKPTRRPPPLRGTEQGRKPYPKGFAGWPMTKKEKYWRENPRPVPATGIAAAVVLELGRLGKLKRATYISKQQLVDLLAEKFPDRRRESMIGNLNNMLPGRLRDTYGLKVEVGIASDGLRGYRLLSQ